MTDLKQKVVDEFMAMVQIDSLSLKEERFFEYLKKRLKDLPVELDWQPYTKEEIGAESGNLVVRLPANSVAAKRSLFFDAHVDTVEPGIGVKPRIDGEYIRTDGNTVLGADDKAGAAAMLVALEEIIASGMEHGELTFVFTSAEEIGLMGVHHLDFTHINADYGYILDSHGSVGGVIIAAPYHYYYNIDVKGKASHAGIAPEEGISAIKIASLIVGDLPQGRINEDTVANVGIIEGGKASNIVPEECRINGEFRSLNVDDIPLVTKVVETAVDRFRKQAVDIKLEIVKHYDGFVFSEDSDIIEFTDRALREIGIDPRHEKTGGGSNTNIYNQNGINAITLACGMMGVHSTDEYIAIQDLLDATRLIIKMAELA